MHITAMTLNLMISERVEQRTKFANEIKQIVDSESEHLHLVDIFNSHLLKHLDRVVENPNCQSRTFLFGLVEFWNDFLKAKPDAPKLAA